MANDNHETSDSREKWDARYSARLETGDDTASPAQVLIDYVHLLPAHGRALDLACGLGANARLLARQGLAVEAWDISPVAIAGLDALARAQGLTLHAEACDALSRPLPAGHYDVIVVSYFLERELCPAIAAALRPGGLLYYQTFTREGAGDSGPRNPVFRLAPGELLRLFASLDCVVYREEGTLGNTARGLRGEAMFIGRQPA